MARWIFFGVLLGVASAVLPAWGVELSPFAVRNLSPPAMVQEVPVAEAVRLNQPGQYSARLGLDVVNNATLNQSDGERIHLDGQSYVATFGLRYGITERLQVGVDLPWVSHNKGSLDGFIEDWHNFFGLPNGDRDNLPKNELNYAYASNSGDHFLVDHKTSGIGDVRLLAAWQLLADDELAASLLAALKTPTGDADDLTGSGGWGASVAIAAQRDFSLGRGTAAIWGGVGGSWLGNGDVLEDRVEDWAVSGWVGAGWSPLNWLGLKLQLDCGSALYDSDLDELGDPPLILTMGGTLGLGEKTSLDIGVGEDLAVDASPDVTFHLNLKHAF